MKESDIKKLGIKLAQNMQDPDKRASAMTALNVKKNNSKTNEKSDVKQIGIKYAQEMQKKYGNTSYKKPEITVSATKPVVQQPVTTEAWDEDALRNNMAATRKEPSFTTKALGYVGSNLYNGVVKPISQGIDKIYEKADDYNFGEKALNDAYATAVSNSQNVWDEDVLRTQRLINDRNKLLSYMTPEQKQQYNSLPEYQKKDYLDSIMAELQSKFGAERAEEILAMTDKGNQAAQLMGLSFESGSSSAKSGVKGAYNLMRGAEDTVAKGASEYAFANVRPQVNGAMGVAMDVGHTVGNMAPSMAAGVIAAPLGFASAGTALMGVSAAGRGYDEAIGQGYTPEKAAAYGVASGISEAALQKIVGALPGVSNAQGLVTKFLGKYGDDVLAKALSNPATRKAITTIIGNAASEGAEEGAQEAIDVLLRNTILGEDNKLNWKDIGYSAALGAITGGTFAAPGGVNTYVNGRGNADVTTDVEAAPAAVSEENKVAETITPEVKAPVAEETVTQQAEIEPEEAVVSEAVKQTAKAVNPKAQNSQEIYRQIMRNNNYGKLVDTLDMIAKKFNIKLNYYADNTNSEGYYENGTVNININNLRDTADGVWKLAKHELTHFIEGTEGYGKLLQSRAAQDIFNNYLVKENFTFTTADGNTLTGIEALNEIIKENYAKNGVELSPTDLQKEVVARLVEESGIFTSEESIRRLAEEDPGLIERIHRWIKDTIAKLRGGAETRQLMKLEKMYERALSQAAKGEYQYNRESERQNLFVKAKEDQYRLMDVMESKGMSKEEIWKETGLIRDAKGNVITEINDKDAKFYPNGDLRFRKDHPEYARYEDLYLKLLYEDLTESELAEFKELGEIWGRERERLKERFKSGNAKLGDVFEHAKLYEIMPELENVPIRYVDNLGSWGERSSKGISISSALDKSIRDGVILHEVQHELQHREYRPGGASPEYWQGRIRNGESFGKYDKQIKIAEQEKETAWMQMPEEAKEKVREINREMIKARETGNFDKVDELETAMYNSEYADLYEDYASAQWELEMYTSDNKPLTANELYRNTAGEIEARQTESRRNLTDEERRNKMPDLGWDDARFADGSTVGYHASKTEEKSIKKQISDNLDTINELDPVAVIYSEGRNGLNISGQYKAVLDLLKSTGYKVDRKGFGEIIFEENQIKRSLDYINTDAEFAAYEAIPKVLKRGKQIDNHEKHKGREYNTYTFAAPIKINGKPAVMAVVVRKTKGNRYKVHRVVSPDGGSFEFNKTKNTEPTTVRGVTETGSLAKHISSVSNDIISDSEQNNKKSFSFKEDRELNKKSEQYLHRATNTLLNDFLEITEANKYADVRSIKKDINTFAEASAKRGSVDREEANKLFDVLFSEALVKDAEIAERYGEAAQKIKATKFYGGGLGSLEGRYRRDYFGKIRLVTDPAATKIDSFYKELSENHPDIVDPDITNIEDQVQALANVVDEANNSLKHLNEFMGNYTERAEKAREAFMASLDNFEASIGDVIRYTDDREVKADKRARIEEAAAKIGTDKAYAGEFFGSLNKAQKAYDKLARKEMLTKEDLKALGLLASGQSTIESLENSGEDINIGAVKRLENAFKAKYELEQVESAWRKKVKSAYNQLAVDAIEDSDSWKEKGKGELAYSREIEERIVEDLTAPAHDGNRRNAEAKFINQTYFKPVHENEAKSNRMKKKYEDKIKALNLGTDEKYTVMFKNEQTGLPVQTQVSESGLVQLYGEKLIDDKILESVGADKEKIHNAVDTFRSIYDELLDSINTTLIKNGYRPIEKRKDYFPHFSEDKPDTTLAKVAGYFGIDLESENLPTDIAGISDTFRPGKKWVGNFLQRKTNVTDYDALKGFDRYINGASDVIWHTDDIQRLRALETQIRLKHSDEGLRRRLLEIEADETLTTDEKNATIEELFKKNNRSHLSTYATHLRSYTDSLAGKKHRWDRPFESLLGRRIYNTMSNIENRISANMVAFNPGSWLTNVIPITQLTSIVDSSSLAQALADTGKRQYKNDGFTEKSDFLVNRKGVDPVYKTKGRKFADKITWGFSAIDDFSSEVVTRALYYDAMKTLKNEEAAMDYANDMAARLMADRSKGAKPDIFNMKNPVAKLLTMFQVEVNNQYSFMLKDLPADLKDRVGKNLLASYLKMFLAAYLFNDLYEYFVGRRSALDPIGLVNETAGGIAGKKVNNIVDIAVGFASGEGFNLLREVENAGTADSIKNLGKEVVNELPFVGGLLGGGRIPIQSALPDLETLFDSGVQLVSKDTKGDKRAIQKGVKEITKPIAYLGLPIAGGQLKKSAEGISTLVQGGEKVYNSEGEEQLKYPIEEITPLKIGQAVLFGRSALPEAQNYYNSGSPLLSAKQTQNYYKAVEAGINYEQYMTANKSVKGLQSDKDKDGKTIPLSLDKKKKAAIDAAVKDYGLSKKQKEILYEANEVSESVW